jgi:hypothetical protein
MIVACGRGVVAMPSVAAMHEHVQQQAGEQNQKREQAEYMGPVFGNQVEARNGQKRYQDNVRPRVEPSLSVFALVIVFHVCLLECLTCEATSLDAGK